LAEQEKKRIIKEFKEFALRGSVIDLAVGVVIGGVFSKIVTSLVNDIMLPFLGMFIGNIDFSEFVIKLPDLFGSGKVNNLNVGSLISATIDFIIIAWVIFLFVKVINRFKRKEKTAAPAPKPSAEEKLLTEIRDLLKER
jgi:large conductance mechanosensitive channel